MHDAVPAWPRLEQALGGVIYIPEPSALHYNHIWQSRDFELTASDCPPATPPSISGTHVTFLVQKDPRPLLVQSTMGPALLPSAGGPLCSFPRCPRRAFFDRRVNELREWCSDEHMRCALTSQNRF